MSASSLSSSPVPPPQPESPHEPYQVVDDLNFYHFFGALLTSDPNDRIKAANAIADVIRDAHHNRSVPHNVALLNTHIPSLIRLSLECPFVAVRTRLSECLIDIKCDLIPRLKGPSYFISQDDTVDIDGDKTDSPLSLLFTDLFLSTGRVTHIEQLMAVHPTFLTAHATVQQALMDEAGPLSQPQRHYLAILAASRHDCAYLINQQEWEFLSKGGDRAWQEGVDKTPPKLQSIHRLNALLAHQPWLINEQSIAQIVRATGDVSWSISELVHAIMIFTTFHSLCGIVGGLGVTPEVDMAQLIHKHDQHATKSVSPNQSRRSALSNKPAAVQGNVSEGDQLMEVLVTNTDHLMDLQIHKSAKAAPQPIIVPPPSIPPPPAQPPQSFLTSSGGRTTKNNAFAAAEESSSSERTSPSADYKAAYLFAHNSKRRTDKPTVLAQRPASPISDAQQHQAPTVAPAPDDENAPFKAMFDRYRDGRSEMSSFTEMKYAAFDVYSAAYSPLFSHTYGWKSDGVALVNRYLSGFGTLIDDEWELIYHLTNKRVGDSTQSVDTGPFRRAVWMYTHRLYGICHDDYNYEKINVFLPPKMKTFIRKVACHPLSVTLEDFALSQYSFTSDEKVHIVILVCEARRQAAVVFALNALVKFMTKL